MTMRKTPILNQIQTLVFLVLFRIGIICKSISVSPWPTKSKWQKQEVRLRKEEQK